MGKCFTFRKLDISIAWNKLLIEHESGTAILQIKIGLTSGIFQVMSTPSTSALSLFRVEYSCGHAASTHVAKAISLEVDVLYRTILRLHKKLKPLYRIWDSHDILRTHGSRKLIGIRRHNFKSTRTNRGD